MNTFKIRRYIISDKILLLIFSMLLIADLSSAQLGFFEDYWLPKTITSPESIEKELPSMISDVFVSVNIADTINKISTYMGGYNINTFNGGKIFDKPSLLDHIKNLQLPLFRYPGGTSSNNYFWDRALPDKPDDVDSVFQRGIKKPIPIRWGNEPGSDYLSLDNSYILRDSCNNTAIHVVNYAYARYGLTENPLQKAAHYAANWVRYDNGRTKFWEIGNENYGRWESGYLIDTILNKDGQPSVISGELYAKHCLVFIDSMRNAASEIGTEIKLGATLGFIPEREYWDIPVLQILNNKVDFYIIHRYFDESFTEVNFNQLLESINMFYNDKKHIDSLIYKYCDNYVPLALTEWNTKYEGRKQNISCANGLHALLGYKAIINEGIGIELRWNLIVGYQDGNTHGLISNEKDNPAIEGIPSFSPRAPFYYIYYFKKFLGDVSFKNATNIKDSLEVFSSGFESGHVGINIINPTMNNKIIKVNIENYQLGDRFYWYTLTCEKDQPFSPKVLVNGETNSNYHAGGPINYSNIKPYSLNTKNGIWIELAPVSATFILVEGKKIY